MGITVEMLKWPSLVNGKLHNSAASSASTKAHPSPTHHGRGYSSIMDRHLAEGRVLVQGCSWNQCDALCRQTRVDRVDTHS